MGMFHIKLLMLYLLHPVNTANSQVLTYTNQSKQKVDK